STPTEIKDEQAEKNAIKLNIINMFSKSNSHYEPIRKAVEYYNTTNVPFVARNPYDVVKRIVEHMPLDVIVKNSNGFKTLAWEILITPPENLPFAFSEIGELMFHIVSQEKAIPGNDVTWEEKIKKIITNTE
ncbi:MAG: hypothetical protein Edafosvirus12_1, partial [Edafosvirus sp.]